MIFKLGYPKSRRFYKLSFSGFPNDFGIFSTFFKDLSIYFLRKVKKLLRLFVDIAGLLHALPMSAKAFVIKKLIWSRGRLGRPIANLVVMVTALAVFAFGEVFNNTRFVSGGEVSPDYLSNVVDVIPNRQTTLTLVPEDRKRTEPFDYTVSSGDTLFGVGEKFKISTDALKYVNNLTDYSVLKIGQKITIPPVSGLIHKAMSGDTLDSIAEKYQVPVQAIADFNYILDTSTLAVGSELVIPDAKIPQPVYKAPQTPSITTPVVSDSPVPSKNLCVWPSTVRIITQYYSWYHNGVDIAVSNGRPMPPLFACTDGIVVRAGWDPFGLGLNVRIDHGNGYETVYGHMSRIDVSYGERVSRGQVIGIMGTTGRSTGPHVHFMVKYGGVAQNPLSYVN